MIRGIHGQELSFTDRTTGTRLSPVLPALSPHKDQSTRRIRTCDAGIDGIVEGAIPQFEVDGISANRTQVLAYSLEQDSQNLAALRCQIGNGHVTFWAPSLENIAEDISGNDPKARLKLLRWCLERVGLRPPHPKAGPSSLPLPQILLSTPEKPGLVQAVVLGLGLNNGPGVFRDSNDSFEFHPYEKGLELLRQIRLQTAQPNSHSDSDQADSPMKHIIVCPGGMIPSADDTPLFDLQTYFTQLRMARSREGCRRDIAGFGETMIYGQVVTSTQTMFDKNPRLLAQLPASVPVLSLGSQQLAGRGRGSNAWISPAGCLQFSLLLPNNPTSSLTPSYIPPSKLVFVQYLFALAVVEACRSDTVLGPKSGEAVRIKWPNDIYAYSGGPRAEKLKIGGVLVSTTFAPGGQEADIVIGCGLNVLCSPPLFALFRLLPISPIQTVEAPSCPDSNEPNLSRLSLELTLATVLSKFEKMWDQFLSSGGDFEPFLGTYLERWMHSDQLVQLTTVSPPKMVRICGITLDHGLLRTLPERTGAWGYDEGMNGYIDLQPDGNSFDLMAGLIKVKR
ncbi:hypothetical protein BDP27DRAFT_1339238 [Rhodocollybia butyracea]|uniref:BPL/LPL catalytic domain-containing protein n=1 Tax=Rhodocollybia butyracea TaxID=206335 RepID=A0A9P5PC84_9AGAR|nr:hypothetical protein BDP27DRAFT_1339238 [Rhodocollybia butyracea]